MHVKFAYYQYGCNCTDVNIEKGAKPRVIPDIMVEVDNYPLLLIKYDV